MAKAQYWLLVDWDLTGNLYGPYDDITADMLEVPMIWRGRDSANTITGVSTAGILDVRLRNRNGKYSSFNQFSPLWNKMLPRRTTHFMMSSPNFTTAIEFTGVQGQHIAINGVEFGESLSVEAWVRPTSTGLLRMIASRVDSQFSAGWEMARDSNGNFRVTFHGPGNQVTGGHIPENQWTHVAFSYDHVTGFIRLYLNGEEVAIESNTLVAPSPSLPFLIGARLPTLVNVWDGRIDDVRVWNTAIDAEAIRARMDRELVGGETGIVGYWPLSFEWDPTLVVDRTVNLNHGTVGGSPLPEWRPGKVPMMRHLWTGYLQSVVPEYEVGRVPIARLQAYGPIWLAQMAHARRARRFDITTGDAMVDLIGTLEIPHVYPHQINPGVTTMKVWWADSSTLYAMRKVERTELGFIRENRGGGIVFEDRDTRLNPPHTQIQTTYTDESANIRYRSISHRDPFENTYNRFTAQVKEYEIGSQAVLWKMIGRQSIPPGETRTVWAESPSPVSPPEVVGAASWTPLVAWTDYNANTEPDGLGFDVTPEIEVSGSGFVDAFPITMKNTGDVEAHVELQARGEPLLLVATSTVAHTVETSPAMADWPSPAEFLPDVNEAQDHVRILAARHSHPVPILTISYIANRSNEFLHDALMREVSDRVRVIAGRGSTTQDAGTLNIDADFFVESVRHRIDRRGVHVVTLELSPVRSIDPYWILDVTPAGDQLVLAY